MGNKDFRRELNSAFDGIAGSRSPALSDRVRAAVANPPEARRQYWIPAVAAVVIAALVISALVLANPLRRPTGPVGAGQPSPSASPSESPTPTSALPAFVCTTEDVASTDPAPSVAYISALSTGTDGGYDRITVEFANGAPTDVKVGVQAGTTFTLAPSGQRVTLQGRNGVVVAIRGADLHTSYSGPIDIVTGYGTLVEVRRLQDFEGVVELGLGVNGSGCYRAFFMTNPDRLVIDVQSGV